MNIALLTKNFNRTEKDAAVTTVLNLAEFLKKRGHNAVIICECGFKEYTGYKKNKAYEVIKNVEVFRPYWLPWFRTVKWFLDPTVLLNGIIFRALAVRYVQKKKKIHFDVIHGFSAAHVFALSTILAKLFCQKGHTVHTIKSASSVQNWFFSLLQPHLMRLYSFIDRITVPLPSMKKNLVKAGIKDKKIHILPSFISLKRFYPKNKNNLRKKYGLGSEKIILYFGPLGIRKGTEYLLRAIKNVKKEIKKVRFILAHPAYFTASQKEYIHGFNIDNCITILEGRLKIEDYINMADAVVLPYTTLAATEANPLCLLESIACKTPVVTTDLPELREIVLPDIDVLMAKPGDVAALSESIIRLLKDSALQKKLAENAFRKIDGFDISTAGNKFIGIYRSLCN